MAVKEIVRCLAWFSLLTTVLLGCTVRETDSESVIQDKFRQRIAALKARQQGDCREDILTEATRRADSLLIERARRMQRIAGRPPRPDRPGAPPVKQLSEPLPLRPLFPFEIRFDTLLRDSLRLDSLRLDSIDRRLLLPPRDSLSTK